METIEELIKCQELMEELMEEIYDAINLASKDTILTHGQVKEIIEYFKWYGINL